MPAELHDHANFRAGRSLVLAYRKHVFERQRLEIEAVAGVVIGRDRLRIAIDHDGLVAIVAQSESRVATAVIEFDSLPYAIRAAAEDDYFFLLSRRGFVFFFVCGIKIWREAFKFCGASVYALINWLQAMLSCADDESFLPRLFRSAAKRPRAVRRRFPCAWHRAELRWESIPWDAFPTRVACH